MHYLANEVRYTHMQYRSCGKSGLKLPCISLGCWHNFGGRDDAEVIKAMCFTAFDAGVTHFDLANNYGLPPGSAECNFGKVLRESLVAYRDELVISTKAGYEMWPGPYGNWGSRKSLLTSLDQSLKRLGLPYVDIFYHHRMDPETPLEETMGALAQAVTSGKALYVGLSNYTGERMVAAAKLLADMKCPFVINQNRFNLFNSTILKNGLLEQSQALGKGVIAFSPLAQGLLSGRYLAGIPADSRVMTDGRFLKREQLTPGLLAFIGALNALACARGETLAQLAVQWILQTPGVTSVLVGASKPEQLRENIQSLTCAPLTTEECAQIQALVAQYEEVLRPWCR